MRAEIGLGEGDGEGGVGGEVEFGVALAPVSGVLAEGGSGEEGDYLMTAILTGAVVEAV